MLAISRKASLRSCMGVTLLMGLSAGLLIILLFGSRSRQLMQSTAEARLATSASWAQEKVRTLLNPPLECLQGLEKRCQSGLLDPDSGRFSSILAGELLERPLLTEVSFISALGQQITAWSDHDHRMFLDRVAPKGGEFWRTSTQGRHGSVPDPRSHLTYSTLTSQPQLGKILWSDLHYSQLDENLPENRRRVVVSVQQAVVVEGKVWGVFRVALDTNTLNREVPQAAPAGHQLFLCDQEGRLVTAVTPSDRLAVTPDDELRWESTYTPFAQALAGGAKLPGFLTLMRPLEADLGYWQVGVVVPETTYLGALNHSRSQFLLLFLTTAGGVAAASFLIFRSVGLDLNSLQQTAAAIEAYQIQPAQPELRFQEFARIGLALQAAEISTKL